MTFQGIIDIIKQDGSSWLVIVVIFATLVQIAPIKIDPWSLVANWLGRHMTKDVCKRLDTLEDKINSHIAESEERDVRLRRESILDFGNSCMNNRKHTKEEFDFIITECDKYEKYCNENNIPNGVADLTIKEIRRIYENCMQDHTFLRGGDNA